MPSVQQKDDSVLVEKAHDLAIKEYLLWLEKHPDATLEKKIKKFDICCDSALLKKTIYG